MQDGVSDLQPLNTGVCLNVHYREGEATTSPLTGDDEVVGQVGGQLLIHGVRYGSKDHHGSPETSW